MSDTQVAEQRNRPHNLSGFIPEFPNDTSHKSAFDTLEATAESLQKDMSAGRITSEQIVEEYQRSILQHNGYLNAVYELSPHAVARARELDEMRSKGNVLGPLHGIPILVKNSINVDPSLGFDSTAGIVALIGSKTSGNAWLVDRLLEAGMIVMGAATLSEMGYFKGKSIRCGWSAAAGHSQSAYVYGGLDLTDSIAGHSSPVGSSAGSAIALSAGFAPVTIGTETFGSLTSPANRAGIYTVKPTLGIVPGDGIMPISRNYDTAGPFGKSVKDIADLLTVLVDPSKTKVPSGGYASSLGGDWSDLKVGTLDPTIWTSSPDFVKTVEEVNKQIAEATNKAYEKIKGLAKSYHANIAEEDYDKKWDLDGNSALMSRLVFGLQDDVDQYLSQLKTSKVRSLQELVDWNKEHAKTALTAGYPEYNQDLLVAAVEEEHDPEKLKKIEAHMSTVADPFMALFDKFDVDVIIASGESGLYNMSAACALPIANLPLSTVDFNGRAFGLHMVARPHREDILVKAMSAWEKTFPPISPPKAFLEASKEGKKSPP